MARLRRDLDRWIAGGLVAAEHRDAILEDVRKRDRGDVRHRFAMVAGLLGAVLIAAGMLLFVGANWQAIPRLARLFLLLAGMWAALGLGALLRRGDHERLAEGAWLIAAAGYGAAIMLVAQMYHIHADWTDGALLWALGALLIAWLLDSEAAAALSLGLLVIWSSGETFQFGNDVQWGFLPAWALIAWLSVTRDWRFLPDLASLALILWVALDISAWFDRHDLRDLTVIVSLLSGVPAGAMTAGLLLRHAGRRAMRLARSLHAHGAAGLLLMAWLTQMLLLEEPLATAADTVRITPDALLAMPPVVMLLALPLLLAAAALWRSALGVPDAVALALSLAWIWLFPWLPRTALLPWLAGAAVLAMSLWLVGYGQRRHSPYIERAALAAFAVEVLYLYVHTLGGILRTSLFMLIGGVLFIAVAWFVMRLARRGREEETGA